MRFLRLRGFRDAPLSEACDSERVTVPARNTCRPWALSRHESTRVQPLPLLKRRSGGCVSFFTLWPQHLCRCLRRLKLPLCALAALMLMVLLITLAFFMVVVSALPWSYPWSQAYVGDWLSIVFDASFSAVVPGKAQPREPDRLWGLTVQPPQALWAGSVLSTDGGGGPNATSATERQERLTARLQARHGAMLFLYTFANGTEANHLYRRVTLATCGRYVSSVEAQLALNGVVTDGKGTTEVCTTPMRRARTNSELLSIVAGYASTTLTTRDRETDELRHSLRSLEQHVRWHRGRVVMVSPGHHPTWIDGAKNFLAGLCGDARVQALRSSGTHLRVTTVHQDAVMPYGMRLTANSHVIEQHLWRVRNMTAVHVYMNDDYFVNRDVAITDLFNEYGGTIVRTESAFIESAEIANAGLPTWVGGVSNTNFVVTDELDLRHEDEVSSAVVRLWQQQDAALTLWDVEAVRQGRVPLPMIQAPDTQSAMWIMLEHTEGLSPQSIALPPVGIPADVAKAYRADTFGTIRPRFYATHAPFVYCTNMLRYLALRYQREFSQSAFLHRTRSAKDLYVPFLYNAFIMARPWQASPRFPSYITLRHQLRQQRWQRMSVSSTLAPAVSRVNTTVGSGGGQKPMEAPSPSAPTPAPKASVVEEEEEEEQIRVAPIELNNDDGCAPATMLVGTDKSGCLFGRFSDDLHANNVFMKRVQQMRPLFFNANAGFTKPEAANQLHYFLQTLFPTPVFLENNAGEETALSRVFGDLMALPVVGVVSFEEGVCPLVRSLALAFAGHHRGGVHVSVQRYGLGEVDATMAEVRQDLRYAMQSAMPAVACTYAPHVTVNQSPKGGSLADLVRRALDAAGETGGGGVELPSTCGGGGGGLRVRGFVVDARTPGAPVRSVAALRDALAVPAQTLSLEDFRVVAVGPSEGDVVLVVSREDADARAVHWVNGASESDLLVTYPLPVEAYEDMSAELRWVEWKPPAGPRG